MLAVLNPLYIAVAWVITKIHSGVGAVIDPNSGLAWVLSLAILVILMRLVLLPLFIKQMHATRKMAAIAPHMQELRKRYKNDRQTLNEETMKLYREHGVNPLGGCLPLVAQLPLFFALFGVLRGISDWRLHDPKLHGRADPLPFHLTEKVILSAQHAQIFGATISDKVLFTGTLHVPLHAKIVILFAVIVSVVTTYLTVRQSNKRGMTPGMTPDNPMAASQKYMTYIVPLFALSGLYWQFGLVLYWMMTNLWTLGQQYVLFKRFPSLTTPVTAAGAAAGAAAASPPAKQGPARPRQGPAGPKQVTSGPRQGTGGPRQAAGGTRAAPGTAKPGTAAPGNSAGNGSQPPKAPAKQPPAPAGTSPTGSAPPRQAPASQGQQPSAAPGKRPPAQPQRKQATAAPGKRPAGGPAKPDGARAAAGGKQAAANGSGLLRRLGRGRSEPEQEPEQPQARLVRQQRVRQSRSKRSGKR